MKADGRKGWKVQYDGRQHISLITLSEAKTCLHDILLKKGEIDAKDSLPLRAQFRQKATKPSRTQGVYLDKSTGVYRGVAIPVGFHANEADAAAAVKAAIRKRPAAKCFGSVDLSMQGESRCDKSRISAAELRQRLPCLGTWGEPTSAWNKTLKQCRKCEVSKTVDCYPEETQSMLVKRRKMYNLQHLCTQCIEDAKMEKKCPKCKHSKPLQAYPSHARNVVAQTGRIHNRKHTCA